MKYLQLLGTCFKLGVQNAAAYRVNFFLEMFEASISLATALIGFAVIFSHTQNLNGWSNNDLLIIVGVYFLEGGILNLMVKPNLLLLMHDIWDGKMDYLLLKPVYSQVLVSIRKIQVWRCIDILTGLVILIIAIPKTISPLNMLIFILTFMAGGVMLYSVFLVLATIAFWTVKLENLQLIFDSMFEAGRWPVGFYPVWLRASLTFIIPVAFAVSIPVQLLTGAFSWTTVLGCSALAIALFTVSACFWRVGVRHYSGTSA